MRSKYYSAKHRFCPCNRAPQTTVGPACLTRARHGPRWAITGPTGPGEVDDICSLNNSGWLDFREPLMTQQPELHRCGSDGLNQVQTGRMGLTVTVLGGRVGQRAKNARVEFSPVTRPSGTSSLYGIALRSHRNALRMHYDRAVSHGLIFKLGVRQTLASTLVRARLELGCVAVVVASTRLDSSQEASKW